MSYNNISVTTAPLEANPGFGRPWDSQFLAGLILYTDRHGTYFKLQVAGHQVCLVHLLRNLQYLNDLNPEQKWSSGIQENS